MAIDNHVDVRTPLQKIGLLSSECRLAAAALVVRVGRSSMKPLYAHDLARVAAHHAYPRNDRKKIWIESSCRKRDLDDLIGNRTKHTHTI